MPRVGFELTISAGERASGRAGERAKTYALDRAATGTGIKTGLQMVKKLILVKFKIQQSCPSVCHEVL